MGAHSSPGHFLMEKGKGRLALSGKGRQAPWLSLQPSPTAPQLLHLPRDFIFTLVNAKNKAKLQRVEIY